MYKNLNFISLYNMKGFYHLPSYIPIITSVTGIWFWLRISKKLEPIYNENSLIAKISNNTKSIMMHHVFCMELLNIILFYTRNIFKLDGFDVKSFLNLGCWYRYYADTKQLEIIYLVVGIVGSLIIARLINVLKEKIKRINRKMVKIRR